MKTISTTVFEFHELDDKAKEKAREWYRRACDGENDFADCVIEDAEQCAELIGVTFATRPVKLMGGTTRQEACVFWSGFSSQGDGACFEGSWSASDVMPGKLKEHAPVDMELHRIAAEFERIAAEFPQSSFTVKHSGHYSHKGCTDFDFESGEPGSLVSEESWQKKYISPEDKDGDIELAVDRWRDDLPQDELKEVARDFMDWIYRQIEKEYEYQQSDECVDETIIANGYEFTKTGHRFG